MCRSARAERSAGHGDPLGGTVQNVSAPAVGVDLSWKTCRSPGCRGVGVGVAGACLAHLDESELADLLAGFSRGRTLDARGATIGSGLLDRIIQAAPVDSSGQRRLSGIRFDGAALHDVGLDGVTFRLDVSFDGAELSGSVSFRQSVFEGSARFAGARFGGHPDFSGAVFGTDAWFAGASFAGDVSFESARFAGPVRFADAVFSADARFDGATFGNDASFQGAGFKGAADFSEASFDLDASFDRATFAGAPGFERATFRGPGGVPAVASLGSVTWSGSPLASWASRAAASLIDHGIPLGVLLVAGVADLALLGIRPAAQVPFYLPYGALAAVVFLCGNLAQQGRTGQSLGKRWLGLRLLSEASRRPVGFKVCVVRQLLHLVLDSLPLPVGWLRPLRDPKRQTVADKVLGTVVVSVGRKWHQANRPQPLPPAPPGSRAGCC